MFSDESRVSFPSCFYTWPGEQHLLYVFTCNTQAQPLALLCGVPCYNTCSPLLVAEGMLNSAMYIQNNWSCYFCKKKAIGCLSRIMPANMMPVLFNMFYKIFKNFSGQCDHQTCVLLNVYKTWLIQLAYKKLLYCVYRRSRRINHVFDYFSNMVESANIWAVYWT